MPDAGQIKVDVSEQDDSFVVTAEVPGVAKEDIDVSVEDAVVTIQAEIKQHDEHKEEGRVLRSELPSGVKTDDAKATYDNGVLKLTLPKQKGKQGTKVAIE